MKAHLLRTLAVCWMLCAFASASAQRIQRRDFFVQSEPGIGIFVREVRAQTSNLIRPVLLIHGARVPGIASFDLRVPGGSLAADLAKAGYAAYIMDARGYGRSTRPPEMSQPPNANPPLVRSNVVVRDMNAVVDSIRRRDRVSRVSLLGWATGGQWAGYYATLFPEKVAHLVLHNTLYGAGAPDPLIGHGSDLEDPHHSGRFNAAVGAWRCNTAEALLAGWDKNIPIPDKNAWRDPAVAQAYIREAMACDPESNSHQPSCVRSPNGALEDSFYQATGRQLWDVSFIVAPTLVIVSGRDFWSRPAGRERLVADLVHAARVRSVVIPDATHFVHLDRPQHGQREFLEQVLAFLSDRQSSR
jgi:pimeloyl-ACP methyl ester carboxylesterase